MPFNVLTDSKNQSFYPFIIKPSYSRFSQGNALIDLAEARLFAKNQQWLEASELYLEWISSIISSTSNAILREFFSVYLIPKIMMKIIVLNWAFICSP